MPPALPPTFTPGRKWRILAHVLVSCLLLAAILAMVNYLASRHPVRFHWSSKAEHRLSPLTFQVLHSLDAPVKIVVFFDRKEPLFSSVADLLDRYQSASSQLAIHYVDFTRFPGRAQQIQKEFELASDDFSNKIIFSAGGRSDIVYAKELSDYDYSGVFTGEEIRRSTFKGEQLFTSAIFSVISSARPKVYFLQNHGEFAPLSEDNQIGFSKFSKLLQENNVAVGMLPSLMEHEIPSDCSLLVIVSPQSVLPEAELKKIDHYLTQGGRLFVLFSAFSMDRFVGLERTLQDWGVSVSHNYVVDDTESKASESQAILVSSFGDHPVVNPLRRSRLHLVMPRSISARESRQQTADAPKVTELFSTSSGGMTRSQKKAPLESPARIPLAVAVEKGSIQGVTRGATRIVAVGDAFFLGNALIESEANRDFANLAVNWLLNRDLLLSAIGPQPIKEYRLTLTSAQVRNIRWLLLALIPGGILSIGGLVWLKRRH